MSTTTRGRPKLTAPLAGPPKILLHGRDKSLKTPLNQWFAPNMCNSQLKPKLFIGEIGTSIVLFNRHCWYSIKNLHESMHTSRWAYPSTGNPALALPRSLKLVCANPELFLMDGTGLVHKGNVEWEEKDKGYPIVYVGYAKDEDVAYRKVYDKTKFILGAL